MRIKLFVLILGLLPLAAFAQNSPVGKWKTLDDKTGKAMSLTEVYVAKDGTYAAKVLETLDRPNGVCTECSGKDKNKPVAGMMVFWGVKKTADGGEGGSGFKPSSGESFKVKTIKLVDGGNKLEVTGCKFVFCRTGTWQRAE